MKKYLIILLTVYFALFSINSEATINWANNATSLLASDITNVVTSLTVTTGQGDRFPAVASPHYFMMTLIDVSGNREIVKVTARTAGSDTMTIVRAQESTSARSFVAGSYVDQRITKHSLDKFSETYEQFVNYYVCDASAADQADTVNSNSLASLVATIGTSLNATIVLPHTGTGNTTAYNVLQNLDLSTYDNITFVIKRGAIITHGANTVDIPTPEAGIYQIFSGTGAVTFTATLSTSYPQWFGATADGSTDDTSAIQSALNASRKVFFPSGTYLVSATIVPGFQRMNFVFDNATIKASAGTYTEMQTYGSGALLGKYVLWDIKSSNHSTYSGNLILNGNSVSNIVGLAASVLGATDGNVSYYEHLEINNCAVGLYGQGTTVSIAGSFTGSRIDHVNFNGCTEDMILKANQDDFSIGVIRSQATQKNLQLETNLSVDSFFLYGNSVSYDGAVLGTNAQLVCAHMFIEGNFRYPITVGLKAIYDCRDLRISSSFSATANTPIYTAIDSCVINIISNSYNVGIAAMDALVELYPTGSSKRTIMIAQPYPIATKAAVLYSAISANSYDNIVVHCDEGIVFHAFVNNALTTRYETTHSPRRVQNSAGTDLGYITSNGILNVPVASAAAYTITNQIASLVELETNSGGPHTISLNNGAGADKGRIISLVANGTVNVVVNSANKAPSTSRTLLANSGGILTIQWDGTNWQEIVFR